MDSAAEAPHGVGGWLLLFCVTLTLLMPAATIVATWIGWPEAEVLAEWPALTRALWVNLAGEALILLYAIRTGSLLWRKAPDRCRGPGASCWRCSAGGSRRPSCWPG
ncbi:hypothetical protein ACFQU2_19050 [Siccirubricoccus deserti]